ncbi:acyl-CoA dehydrogenase/oxidase C-terminal [Mycena rosella]|uniref:Acyl-coenzyme A oxidase n=1 Tax=Mycena rosella TaxID=1033263 RepID=A0AAD7GU30_MYCRO|nr:acyl-CoA dehydrogenase/oxidase C-terminal [Mycena rosella]
MGEARAGASFESRELTNIIHGDAETVQAREAAFSRVEKVLQSSNMSKLPGAFGEVNRTGQLMDGLRIGKAMLEERLQHKDSVFARITPQYWFANASPFGLHFLMFIPALKLLASPEQLAHWLPLAESAKIIGTYCQTELGHGTFLRGMETTATFDQVADQFLIHSPTTSSTKYWPGGLGYSSSHAIVMARLLIAERDYGVHPFIVQLRSLEDYTPSVGVELGDVGLKVGHNSSDNGYAIFTHLCVPRTHLLMGTAQVLRDGTYVAGPHDKLVYSTMLFARKAIIDTVYLQLAQAVTIAIRYSVVREQGNLQFDASDSREIPILAFKSQNYRLFVLMARAFALLFASRRGAKIYDEMIASRASGNHRALAPAHANIAGLKAYVTQTTADGVEDARKCCGGHGYLDMSGFTNIVTTATAMATLEGENFVMYQQTARFLIKSVSVQDVTLDESVAYLRLHVPEARLGPVADFLDPEIQLKVFRHRAARLVMEYAEALRVAQTRDVSAAHAWNTHMMGLISAARAHIEYTVLSAFVDQLRLVQDRPVRAVLQHLSSLFALSCIDSPHGLGFVEDGYISAPHLRQIRASIDKLLEVLLPDAVALTDVWNFSDASLQSALGCWDGDVYERMMQWTRQIPLNVSAAKTGGVFRPGFDEYIRPILRGKL